MTTKRYSSALRLLADSGYLDCYVGSLTGPKAHVPGNQAHGAQDGVDPSDLQSIPLDEYRDESARWRIPLSVSFAEAYARHRLELQRDQDAPSVVSR